MIAPVDEAAITVEGLRKSYGKREAVGGIDFEVATGEVFGFLGPNGAGKTTTIEILEGYRERTAGKVSVLGVDPERATRDWRERIGLVLQESEPDPSLTVEETLELYAGLYCAPRSVPETIELVGLAGRDKARVGTLSGGQRRRVDVGVGLIGDPDLIFLDEPTTGFDPAARRDAWNMIEGLKDLGKTVFLTTHYMDEAQRLSDRVAILRSGRIIAEGSPDTLGGTGGATVVRFRLPAGVTLEELSSAVDAELETSGGEVSFRTDQPQRSLGKLISFADGRGLVLADLGTATMCVLGIAITALTPTTEAVSTIAPFSAVLLSFISGVVVPVSQLPNWLEEIGRVFPLARLADGLQTALALGPARDLFAAPGLSGENLAVFGVWAVGGLLIAVRRFSWEPQARHA
jgi:ABC-2 type transport system ATP-binding protein